jgi:hypothetical protein
MQTDIVDLVEKYQIVSAMLNNQKLSLLFVRDDRERGRLLEVVCLGERILGMLHILINVDPSSAERCRGLIESSIANYFRRHNRCSGILSKSIGIINERIREKMLETVPPEEISELRTRVVAAAWVIESGDGGEAARQLKYFEELRRALDDRRQLADRFGAWWYLSFYVDGRRMRRIVDLLVRILRRAADGGRVDGRLRRDSVREFVRWVLEITSNGGAQPPGKAHVKFKKGRHA